MGKVASDSYMEMADVLYDCNWLELPLKYRKYFIMMIANAQITLNYHGHGIVQLNLKTFIAVSVTQVFLTIFIHTQFDFIWKNLSDNGFS